MQILPLFHRARSAALVALAGGAMAQAMVLWGGSLARFLPPWQALLVAAALGAGVAGFLLADAFGRSGRWGLIWSCVAWPMATALGAGVGAVLLTVLLATDGAEMLFAVSSGAPLGMMAVIDGVTTSPVVAVVWALGGCAAHYGTRSERAAIT